MIWFRKDLSYLSISSWFYGFFFFCTFHFCFGKDDVGDEELQIDDCLSVNHLTGTETVGGVLMALSQTTALSKQYVTL